MSSSKKPKALPKAVLNISHLATKDKVAAVQAITSTAATSPMLKTSTALQQAQKGLVTAQSDVQTSLAAHDGAKKAWMAAEQDLLQKEGTLVAAGNLFCAAVNATPGMDEPTIASLGLKVAGSKTAPRVVTPPSGIATKVGQQPGEVDVKWKPVAGGKSYNVQTTAAAAVTKSRVVLTGLTSGKRTWIRVATVGSSGASGYGSPVAASVA